MKAYILVNTMNGNMVEKIIPREGATTFKKENYPYYYDVIEYNGKEIITLAHYYNRKLRKFVRANEKEMLNQTNEVTELKKEVADLKNELAVFKRRMK